MKSGALKTWTKDTALNKVRRSPTTANKMFMPAWGDV